MSTKTTKKPRVETRPYVTSHGREPRGYGSWAFCPASHYSRGDYLDFTRWFKGTYGEAKKQARESFAGQAGVILALP